MDSSGSTAMAFLWKMNFGAAQGVGYSFDVTSGGKPVSFCDH